MDKREDAVNAILKEKKLDEDERKTAQDFLEWIQDVRNTWGKGNSLHPNSHKTHEDSCRS